jgi:hypothetical protein
MNMFPRLRTWSLAAAAFVCATSAAVPAAAQEPQADIRQELAALKAEIQQLRGEVTALRASAVPQPPAAPAPAEQPAAPAAAPQASLDVLHAQVAELAQTKVESTSKMPVKIFGTVHANVFANSATANWLDNPNLVAAPPADGHLGTFSATLRQTRIGLTMDGPTVGGARASAVVAMDFFGGIPGFQTGQVMGLPRLLVAYARLDGDHTAVEIGQDHMILAPRDPTSLAAFAFPALFRSGNLYLRTPQARVEQALGTQRVRVSAGIVAPIGGDLAIEDYRFVPPALSGERSQRPGVQAHLGFSSGEADAKRLAGAGVSGHYGWERRGGDLAESWAAALDFLIRVDRIGIAGEAFVGDNIDAFGGALGLDARAAGGWAELQLFPGSPVSFNLGGGVDQVTDDERAMLVRRLNRTAYGNMIFALTPEIDASFEYRWLGTSPGTGDERRNHHFDWVLAYKF